MIEERYELALDRIRLMQTEDTVGEPYRDYFKKMAEFVLMLDELRTELLDGRYQKLELDELRKWNRRLYQDVLPGQYEKSYANPDYACKMLGKESGQILGMLYAELRGAVVYVFEGKTEYLAILYELLIEVYNQFEEEPDPKAVRDTFYWYASDYCDVFLADRIREQVLPEESFATDLIMNRAEKKEKVKLFTNPELCDISEDLVFTEPYYDYKGRNIILDQNMDFVKEKLYGDEDLHAEVGQLRDDFMNHAQALIHGDLHSGSIFVNQEGTKVIDPEFAFYGPMGYDIGNVIGNLFFAWANKYYTDSENTEFLTWIEKTIGEVTDKFKEKFSAKWDALVEFPLYKTEGFKKYYTDKVMADSFGYAGTEIIRRVVGGSKVKEVTSVTNVDQRVPMERALIQIGIKLIKERRTLKDGAAIKAVGKEYLK